MGCQIKNSAPHGDSAVPSLVCEATRLARLLYNVKAFLLLIFFLRSFHLLVQGFSRCLLLHIYKRNFDKYEAYETYYVKSDIKSDLRCANRRNVTSNPSILLAIMLASDPRAGFDLL